MQEKLHITCECNSSEHQLIFIKDHEDDEVWVETHLVTYRGFFKRLWVGIRYAFGYKSKYGNFDCVLIKPEDRQKISEFIKTNFDQE